MQIGGVGGLNIAAEARPAAGPEGLFGSQAPEPTGVRAEFLKRAQMSFADQMRAQLLDAMGLTEDDLKAMAAEERAVVEAKIKELIKTQVEQAELQKKGALVDITA
jgi:hypothetical protein